MTGTLPVAAILSRELDLKVMAVVKCNGAQFTTGVVSSKTTQHVWEVRAHGWVSVLMW